MSDSPKIEPALTPEEWQSSQGYSEITVRKDGRPLELSSHGIAALCLHSQDFGFTRDKLTALLALIDRLDGHAELSDEDRALMDWHTDRIEALLPPAVDFPAPAPDWGRIVHPPLPPEGK